MQTYAHVHKTKASILAGHVPLLTPPANDEVIMFIHNEGDGDGRGDGEGAGDGDGRGDGEGTGEGDGDGAGGFVSMKTSDASSMCQVPAATPSGRMK